MLDSTGNHKRTSTPGGFAAAGVATAFRAAT
jgi:hypothetical protein